MEHGEREKTNNEKEGQKEFLEKMTHDFSPLIQRLFGCTIEFGFYDRIDTHEIKLVDYGFNSSENIYFDFNNAFWEKFKNSAAHEIMEIITHEITHLVEEFIKEFGIEFDDILQGKTLKDLIGIGKNKSLRSLSTIHFGSHQKDLEHEHSFEKIQRDILKISTRENL